MMIAALNDLDIEGADIEKAYLTARLWESLDKRWSDIWWVSW